MANESNNRPDIRERIIRRKEAEYNARKFLAKECGSLTTAEEETNEERYQAAVEKYKTALDRQYENFYVTVSEYGHLLRYLRKQKGMSPEELAEIAHVPSPAIEQYETGFSVPIPYARKILERTLGLTAQFKSIRLTDEGRNFLYGVRNYAPLSYDLVYAGRENSKRLLSDLRLTKYFLLTTVLMAILTVLFVALQTLPGMQSYGKYLIIAFGSTCATAAVLSIISHQTTIRRQAKVKRAYFQVLSAMYESGKEE